MVALGFEAVPCPKEASKHLNTFSLTTHMPMWESQKKEDMLLPGSRGLTGPETSIIESS